MTFRETDSVVATDTGQFRVTATEPKRRGRPAQVVGKVGAAPVDDELDRVVDSAIETEATPALSDEALRASASPAEDPVRLYLKEIGKVSLLKAAEEVALGQRIEIGQIALRRALGRVPFATSQLLALVDRVRREELPLEDVILLPEGGEPSPSEIRSRARPAGPMKMNVVAIVSTSTKPMMSPLRTPMKNRRTTITMATASARLSMVSPWTRASELSRLSRSCRSVTFSKIQVTPPSGLGLAMTRSMRRSGRTQRLSRGSTD